MMRLPLGMMLMSLMVCLTGCYDRWTGNYEDIPELDYTHAAVLEKNELTEEERQKQRELLKSIASEKIPVYTINGGDKLDLKVYNHPDLSATTVITPDGCLGMVLIGEIKVGGMTLGQACEHIEKALSKYLRNPKVGLYPLEIVSETATIAGAVSQGGIYPIVNGMKLADLFAKAGGPASRLYDGVTLNAADYPNSVFIRNNKIVPVDFIRAIEFGDPVHNIPIRRGDYIFISARENSQVYVVGEIKNPRHLLWHHNLSLLELLAEGGWLKDIRWKNVIIIRGGLANPQMYKVNLDGILRGELPNVALKSGDIVYIPKDNISEYNVFINKLMPTAQLVNMMLTPASWMYSRF